MVPILCYISVIQLLSDKVMIVPMKRPGAGVNEDRNLAGAHTTMIGLGLPLHAVHFY